MIVDVTIIIEGDTVLVQALRNGLANSLARNTHIAGDMEIYYKDYVSKLNRHRTAKGLGAEPTNHLEKSARRIESDAEEGAAFVRIPRSTGLGRAFGDLNIRPRAGKKYLTIPAHRTTYGKRVGEISHDMRFGIVGGRHRALVFTNGPDKGSVAYWLRTAVRVPQDRTLLPSDADATEVAVRSAKVYLVMALKGGVA
jgi:hypothetical protein